MLMSGFLLKSAVTKAEIIWCLNSIAIHGSLCSTAASASLFPFMFPAWEVATKLVRERQGRIYHLPWYCALLSE
uniref:Putative transposase-like protein n=1 Tax=Ixodes ricinus TaxID=34613 RepID=A0A6B0U2U5_IXORI